MAKLDLDIILIDDSVVMNGFRAQMSGAQLAGFQANPVMLYMHNRSLDSGLVPQTKNTILPIGKWYDIRVEGNQLKAKPDFDDNDEFAKQIESKVKGGYLSAASIWIEPVAASDDAALMLPGQCGPTITQWGVLEASIVDIPNCRNALAIRNSAGKKITLSAETESDVNDYLKTLIPNNDMDKKILAVKLGLTETATDAEIANKLAATLADANKVTQLTADKAALEKRVSDLTENEVAVKAESLVDGAIAAGKLAAGERDRYIKLAKADYATTKEILDAAKPYKSLETILGAAGANNAVELGELLKLSGRDLYMDGKLGRLKELDPEAYKLKYKEYFKHEPKS